MDISAVKRALVALVCRHENLRSSLSVEEDAAWLEISDAVADFFEVVDGGVRGFLERDAALALLSDRLQEPYDVEKGPLVRVVLVVEGADPIPDAGLVDERAPGGEPRGERLRVTVPAHVKRSIEAVVEPVLMTGAVCTVIGCLSLLLVPSVRRLALQQPGRVPGEPAEPVPASSPRTETTEGRSA